MCFKPSSGNTAWEPQKSHAGGVAYRTFQALKRVRGQLAETVCTHCNKPFWFQALKRVRGLGAGYDPQAIIDAMKLQALKRVRSLVPRRASVGYRYGSRVSSPQAGTRPGSRGYAPRGYDTQPGVSSPPAGTRQVAPAGGLLRAEYTLQLHLEREEFSLESS